MYFIEHLIFAHIAKNGTVIVGFTSLFGLCNIKHKMSSETAVRVVGKGNIPVCIKRLGSIAFFKRNRRLAVTSAKRAY